MPDEPVEIIARTLRHTTIGSVCDEPTLHNFATLIVAALTEADWAIVPAWDEVDHQRMRTWETLSPVDAATTLAWVEALVGDTEGAISYVQAVRRCPQQDGRLEVDVYVDVVGGDSFTDTRYFADVTPPAWPSPSVR